MKARKSRLTANRRGAALMTVMLLVLLLLVAIVGAWTRTTTERRTALDATAQVDAYTMAQSGIDKYLVANPSQPTTLPDSVTYNVTGGKVTVTLRYFRRSPVTPVDTILLITSRAEVTNDRYNATAPRATRTVSQFLRFAPATFDVDAGFFALAGFEKNGASGTVSGVDHCTTAPAPLASIPGLGVPSTSGSPTTPDLTQSGGSGSGWMDGNPDNAPVILGTPGPTGTAKDNLSFDWYDLSQRTNITPDYYKRTVSPTVGWTPSTPPTSSNARLYFVQGDVTLNGGGDMNNGYGILIVTGNLTLGGSWSFNGIVMVGGKLTSNGNNTIYGATYTGLNISVPAYNPPNAANPSFPIPTASDLGNGTKTYQYDSCMIKKALSQYGDWARLGNAWTDNWPSY
ncbi:MAG: hypothetical protein V4558_04760 [Gemmatimonadota bacterium]